MAFQWLFLLLFILPVTGLAQLQIPPLTGPVVDEANLIEGRDQRALDQVIREFHQRGKGQIQVLTLRDLGGLSIEQASIQIADQWKLGTAKGDDGVLILIAAQERRMRIEVGQGLEGVLPDVKAKRIISDVMTPLFRQGSPSKGILAGTLYVLTTIDPEFDLKVEGGRESFGPANASVFQKYEGLFFLLFIILMIILNIFRPRRRFLGGFGGPGPWGGGGWSGGGGFGGGGGGWSGGGGGFSGGGASGSW